MASLYKRGGRYWIGYYQDGFHVNRSLHTMALRFIPSSLLPKDLRVSSGLAESATMCPHRSRTEELRCAS